MFYTRSISYNEKYIYYRKKFATVNQHMLIFNFSIIVKINILFIG